MEPRLPEFSPEKVFFTSDTHFFHAGIIRHVRRPYADVSEMNDALVDNWNRTVPADGTVFHLGDFCFGSEAEWNAVLDRLKGRIYLVLGNHDLPLVGKDVMRRFAGVSHEMAVKVGGRDLILNHYPLLWYGGAEGRAWQLFGHIHSGPEMCGILPDDRAGMLLPCQYDVGVDNNGFSPVPFERICEIVSFQTETGGRYRFWERPGL